MTKAELVTEISAKTSHDETIVLQAIEAMMKVIRESLIKGENVYLRGFGSFIIKKRARKVGRNITKNTFVIIPEHFVPAFKPVKTFVTKVKNVRNKVTESSTVDMRLFPTTGAPKSRTTISNSAAKEGKVVKMRRTPLAERSWDEINNLGGKASNF